MLENDRELGVKIETTPGTFNAPGSSDVIARMRAGDTLSVPVEMYDPEEVQGSSSVRPLLPGVRGLEPQISYVLRAPDSLSSVPAAAPLLRSAMLRYADVTLLGIGAITSGPFVHGETVTGGTSGETATVIIGAEDGEDLRLIDLSGAFQAAEVITGGTSGATATSSDTGTDGGSAFLPSDSEFGAGEELHHVSVDWRQGGFYWRGRGCLSEATMEMQVGRPAIMNHTLRGAFSAHGDAAAFGVNTYPEESNDIPRWLNSELTFGSYSPELLVAMTLDFGVQVELLQDANDTSVDGVRYAGATRSGPTITVDPKAVLAADWDLYTLLTGGSTFALSWKLGTDLGDGLIWEFYAPEVQVTEAAKQSRSNYVTNQLTLRLCGKQLQEFVLLQR